MIKELNKMLADLNVLNVKIHTFHYNVVGHDFYPTHKFLEEEFELITNYIDEVAEEIKIQGSFPLGTIKEMMEVSTVLEFTSKDYESKVAYSELVKDYEMLINSCRKIRGMEVNQSTEDMVNDIEGVLGKKLWFMKATIK